MLFEEHWIIIKILLLSTKEIRTIPLFFRASLNFSASFFRFRIENNSVKARKEAKDHSEGLTPRL